MKRVAFYSLPRAVQDHVVDSLAGRLVPVPILARFGARPKARAWWALSAAATLFLLLLCLLGIGNAKSSLSLHPLPVAALYVLSVGAITIGFANAAACRARVRALPFAPGIYLFPANVIDAREPELRVFPLAELASAGAASGGVALAFGSERFVFPLGDPARLPEALARIEQGKAQTASETDPRARFELDALEPPSVMSPLAPQHPMSYVAPSWLRGRWALAAVVGLLLGAGLFFVRNTWSDNRMLATAQAKDDIEPYREYLGRGKRHRAAVADVLLPRAELRAAVAQGSVDAIDEFIASHPKTGIQAEVDAARRAALIAELERAKGLGTLSALLDFAARHPDHGLGPELAAARHALFQKVLATFEKGVPEGETKTVELVRSLLAYSEKVGARSTPNGHLGPVVQIRFSRQPSNSLSRADSAVSKNPSFNGAASYPTRYLGDKYLGAQEEWLANHLGERLSKAFPKEMLSFERGPATDWSGGDELPELDKPTLVVSYRIEWSGGAFAKRKPRIVLIGLFVFFRSAFVVPGDGSLLGSKFTAAENIPRDLVEQDEQEPPGTAEARAYDAMLRHAFGQFAERYLAKWVKP